MPLIPIDAVILDFKPGSTGIVYFKTRDGVSRKTPELQPVIFNSLCAVLERPSFFDSDAYSFRNIPGGGHELHAEQKAAFTDEELKNTSNFKTWKLQ